MIQEQIRLCAVTFLQISPNPILCYTLVTSSSSHGKQLFFRACDVRAHNVSPAFILWWSTSEVKIVGIFVGVGSDDFY